MGYYIETPGNTINKAEYLVIEDEAEVVPIPLSFSDIPSDRALICVVNNGTFDAAGYAYSEAEFKAFSLPEDRRPKIWLTMPLDKAQKLSGYTP